MTRRELARTRETTIMTTHDPAEPADHRPPYYGTRLRSVRVDDELWAAAKAEATRRGESLNGAIRDFLHRYTHPRKR